MRERARKMVPVALAAAGLIVLRTAAYLLFEQISFDSDQAIVGLMAKHLSEGRAFPLFFYGQTYMLGVEAWAAVPFVLTFGPTVTALRLSLLLWNVICAVLLIVGLSRHAGLRPWTALVPVLFFAAAPPSIAGQLVNAQGGIIEPFVYVPLLWMLRDRPLWFGLVLGIGFRNREFTLYAVPALLVVQVLSGAFDRARLRTWLIAMVGFFLAWEAVEALKPFADLAGPGTRGELLGGFSGSQVDNLVRRFNFRPAELTERVTRMGPVLLAWFTGGAQVESALPVNGHRWLWPVSGAFVLLGLVRLLALILWPSTDGDTQRLRYLAGTQAQVARAAFPIYVLGVGIIALAAFIAGKPVLEGYSRYALLGVLLLVGLTGALLALEPRLWIRRLLAAAAVAWVVVVSADHLTVLRTFVRNPPPHPVRELADVLVTRGVKVAQAGYWTAYETTFVARERVRVASVDFVRIEEYHRIVPPHERRIHISTGACPGGERVASFYLCAP